MTWAIRLSILVTLAVATAAGLAGGANACSPSDTDHCYGQAYWGTPTSPSYTGGLATVTATKIHVGDISHDWANHEMWVETYNFTGSNVVEAGLHFGLRHDSCNCGQWVLEWFVAYYVEDAEFTEVPITDSVSRGIGYADKISWNPSIKAFQNYLNGNWRFTYPQNDVDYSLPIVGLTVGSETTDGGSQGILDATGSGLQKRLSDNSTWTYNWTAPGYPSLIYTRGPICARWLTVNQAMLDRENAGPC